MVSWSAQFSTESDCLAALKQLVEIESPTFDLTASGLIALLLESHFTALGANVRLVRTDAGTNLVADVPGTGAPLLFVGHTDTVWPVGTIETTVPWSEKAGIVAGPGIYDMKSGIVVMLSALSRVRGTNHRAVRVVLTCDEEVGSPTTQSLLKEASEHTSAALGFESPHPDGALKIGRRGSSRVRISTTGRAAHAALDPELGISAIDELIDQLVRVRAITAADDLPSEVLSNVGKIAGGERTNVVPDLASAEIGLRFMEPEAEGRILSELNDLKPVRSGARLDVELMSSRPAWRESSADSALFARVSRAASSIGQMLDARPASGAGDTNLFGSLGIPTLDGFGPRGGGAHATTEHIVLSSLFERTELLIAVLTEEED